MEIESPVDVCTIGGIPNETTETTADREAQTLVVASAGITNNSITPSTQTQYTSDILATACLRMQWDVFTEQAAELELELRVYGQLLAQARGAPQKSDPHHHPSRPQSLLARERIPKHKHKLVDDVELVLLALLDEAGRLSVPSRVSALVVLMSRATLTDHRVLVLHVLAKRASPQCQSEFLRQGGLRLLPRLIQNALKEESVGELEAIVNLMRALPLDQSMLSFAGLGKSVRKLSKLKSAQRDTVALNAAAQGFINEFKSKLEEPVIADPAPVADEDLPSAVRELSVRTASLKAKIPDMAANSAGRASVAVESPATSAAVVPVQDAVGTAVAEVAQPRASRPAEATSRKEVTRPKPFPPSAPQQETSFQPFSSSKPKASTALLAATTTATASSKVYREEPYRVMHEPPGSLVVPVRGILRGLSVPLEQQPTLKRKLSWTDTASTSGRRLAECLVFEVDSAMTRGTSAYRKGKDSQKSSCSKEMNKREAEREAKARKTKPREQITSMAQWGVPARLRLPESTHHPKVVMTSEEAVQSSRLEGSSESVIEADDPSDDSGEALMEEEVERVEESSQFEAMDLSALPSEFLALDPVVLEKLTDNPLLLESILLGDGSVDRPALEAAVAQIHRQQGGDGGVVRQAKKSRFEPATAPIPVSAPAAAPVHRQQQNVSNIPCIHYKSNRKGCLKGDACLYLHKGESLKKSLDAQKRGRY